METQDNPRVQALVGKFGLLAAVMVTGVWVAACATTPPPTEQLAVSTAALARAVTAGAGEAAPMEMRLARDKLEGARIAMQGKDYEVARKLALEAQVDAQLAEAKAQSSRAGKAAGVVQEDSRVLREELERKSK
ncbi:MAG TPA: DUF4398 domain-containing protein [Aquabacterium sp.]|uniref:DUF4398 domain-containing protein n=1 Tax=Aquabacterium sp. TaxID=1872578 RepID=UPI002E3232FD|nr:DUF4398 domain-containing protein [Aquabacterium sp.]HEX5357156.1 DUF4398 domain-containing protein [Aquabacterium sp.]